MSVATLARLPANNNNKQMLRHRPHVACLSPRSSHRPDRLAASFSSQDGGGKVQLPRGESGRRFPIIREASPSAGFKKISASNSLSLSLSQIVLAPPVPMKEVACNKYTIEHE